jgi:hypothetical protein
MKPFFNLLPTNEHTGLINNSQ